MWTLFFPLAGTIGHHSKDLRPHTILPLYVTATSRHTDTLIAFFCYCRFMAYRHDQDYANKSSDVSWQGNMSAYSFSARGEFPI